MQEVEFNLSMGKIPQKRRWQPASVFLPGESQGQRSLAGYRPRSHKELRHLASEHPHTGLWAAKPSYRELQSLCTAPNAAGGSQTRKLRLDAAKSKERKIVNKCQNKISAKFKLVAAQRSTNKNRKLRNKGFFLIIISVSSWFFTSWTTYESVSSVAQFSPFSRSDVCDSLRPHESQHTRLPFPSPNPGVYPNSCPSGPWCHPTIPSSVITFSSCLQSFPASVPFSSVAHLCPTPGFPVHHQLPDLIQTDVHRVDDAIQLSHLLSSPSPPAINLSQNQGLFKGVSSSHQVAKVLEFQLQHQSFQWIFRTDFL